MLLKFYLMLLSTDSDIKSTEVSSGKFFSLHLRGKTWELKR